MAAYAFLDQHYLKFSRGKLSDFEGMMWYLQGFVLLGWCLFFVHDAPTGPGEYDTFPVPVRLVHVSSICLGVALPVS